ncbi:MAG: aspartate aminotransferase family protein [Elusimicrobiota bacterium]
MTPGLKSAAVFNEEQKYLAPGVQSIAALSGLAIDSGRGSTLKDLDGNEYLDFAAGVGVASLGHAHPKYVRALSDQLSRVSVGSFCTPRRLSFARALSSVAPPGLCRVQLYSSGSEAVEAALRLAKSRTKRCEAVSFWGGFHGKTGGVLGLLGDDFKRDLGPLMPGLYQSPYPDSRRCPLGAREQHDCSGHCLDFLREMIRRETAGSLCAIILEPMQGTSGNLIPPPGFVAGVKDVAHENGALFIADEMITGFGRTGRWFGVEHENVVPDIMTIGKGMAGGFPVSGLATTEDIAAAKPFSNPSGSSSSYGGNPLAAAAADATLSILREENLIENSRAVGEALLNRLKDMRSRVSIVGDVRGRGLMIGVDLIHPKTGAPLDKALCRDVFARCLRRGLIAMSYAPSVRINPPLVITKAEALLGAERFEEALASAAKQHGL